MAKKGIYSKTPVVPAKQIAGTNPISGPGIGGGEPRTVPQAQPTIHGFDMPAHTFRMPAVKGSHGFGHVARMKQGHLRMSGSPSAHRVGSKKS